jgi:hypothetical protein
MHPSVERRGALLASAAGLNSHGVGDSLDGVSQTYFLLDEEPRKTNVMRVRLGFLPVILGCFFPVHDTLLPL